MRKILLPAFTFFCAFAFAQETEKISIAVLPFLNTTTSHSNYSSVVQELVTKEFVKGHRFTILDRSKFQRVLDELKIQKSEEFLNSKIVEQGKVAGAQFLVTGVLTEMGTRKEMHSYTDPNTGKAYNTQTWKADIRFSFQVIDVATSKAIYAENINASNGSLYNTSEASAMDNAQCKVNKAVKGAVMKMFAEEIEVVKVEKATKKGLPELVLISAGNNYFDENYSKGDECEKGLDKAFSFLSKKESIKLKVYEIEILNVNGKEVKREKLLGKLKLKEVQGELSVCEVDEGAKEMKEKLDAKQKLLVKIL